MISGTVLVIPCPVCGQQGRKKSVVNENLTRRELWSDGKKISPDHHYSSLVRCRKCTNFFYAAEEDAVLKIESGNENNAGWINVPYFHLPSFEEYFEGLGTELFEKYLRWEALHSYNDIIRNNREYEITPDMQDLYEDNLKSLLYFLSEDDPDELFVVIEINRQLGKFDKCLKIIKKADDTQHKRMKSIFLKEIEKRNKKLFRIY
jgi:hypothetical protein